MSWAGWAKSTVDRWDQFDWSPVYCRCTASGRFLEQTDHYYCPGSSQTFWLCADRLLASILTLWYYLLIQRKAFFGPLNDRWLKIKEAPFWMSAANVILALLCLLVGIFFTPVFKIWISPAAEALARGVQQVLMWGI